MSKHTPGVWEIDDSRDTLEITNESRIGHIPIAEVSTGFDGPIEAEQWANAHLIAAAPEMLEVLKEVLAAPIIYDGGGYDESIDTCGHTGLQPLREKLRYVVAKAEGRK